MMGNATHQPRIIVIVPLRTSPKLLCIFWSTKVPPRSAFLSGHLLSNMCQILFRFSNVLVHIKNFERASPSSFFLLEIDLGDH